jgi:DNA-binding NtrC family response regulator
MLPDHGARARQAETLPLQEACERFERQIVLRVLERTGWNQTEAARLLGVHRNTLKQRVARWNLQRPGNEG